MLGAKTTQTLCYEFRKLCEPGINERPKMQWDVMPYKKAMLQVFDESPVLDRIWIVEIQPRD